MPRFFTKQVDSARGVLTGEDARHAAKSLRMKVGDAITLCNTQGEDFFGTIASIAEDSVTVDIVQVRPSQGEPSVFVHLFQGFCKGDKMDWIVQKAVELGVGEMTPVLTAFCVARPDKKAQGKKAARLQKIALEACKQSGRGKIPQVNEGYSFVEYLQFVDENPDMCHLLCYEKGGEGLPQAVAGKREISLFVGSEGGFAPEEVARAVEKGVVPTSLGPRILRCETAPLAALSVIMSCTGNL